MSNGMTAVLIVLGAIVTGGGLTAIFFGLPKLGEILAEEFLGNSSGG